MRNIAFIFIVILSLACGNNSTKAKTSSSAKKKNDIKVDVPKFNADSAYAFVEAQVDFGPRVPNTKEHIACANFLSEKLKSFGADVIMQEAEVRAFDNTLLNAKNIIGQYKPELNNRILLFAHWDTRPFADHDEDTSKQKQPILGANDGASGVGVLLEIARNLQNKNLPIGIDIIFFDAEDYGTPDFEGAQYKADTWCLGSQYWGKNPHKENYYAQYGILLDMVGAPNATFNRELHSLQFAPRVVKKVWKTAEVLGYGNYFVYEKGGMITDDHVYVNKHLNIPCIDIIQHDSSTDSNFGSYWHTHDDTMEHVDKNTLKAVGQTVLEVIFNEN